jgi:hypothetical protein
LQALVALQSVAIVLSDATQSHPRHSPGLFMANCYPS